MKDTRVMPLLKEASPMSAYPDWDYAMADPDVRPQQSTWVARHRATGLIMRGGVDYVNNDLDTRVVGVRSSCCGTGLMRDRGDVLCLNCKIVTGYHPDLLNNIVRFDKISAQAHWWELYMNPLDAMLQASEAAEVARELEAAWQALLPA